MIKIKFTHDTGGAHSEMTLTDTEASALATFLRNVSASEVARVADMEDTPQSTCASILAALERTDTAFAAIGIRRQ
jgi:hypothetical protein